MAQRIKVGFVSLGCSKNLIDTEVMLKHVLDDGCELAETEEADVVIINTCAFIESAKKESIDNILDVAWLKKNRSLKGIIVTGCLAERYRDEVLNEIPEVDAVIGVGGIHKIAEAVKSVVGNYDKYEKKIAKKNRGTNVPVDEKYACFDEKEELVLGGDRVVTTGDAMAYIKISEGCNNRCTYCAIPGIRGKMRSRTIEDIVNEAKSLSDMGVKELNIIAQDTSAYGYDIYGEYKLPELIRAITDATKIPWIRLLYCYPDKITDELIAEIRDNDRVVKYIDIPIQHINDSVLKRMNRHGDSAMIKDAIKRLRDNIPGIVLRTTAIVGFPGETDEEFEELCKFVKETKFERFGAFTYSREEGTPAYDFDNQIDEQTKQDRYDIIMKEQSFISEKYNNKRVGKTVKVLCEGFDVVSESHFGRSSTEAADIDGKIWFSTNVENLRIAEGEMVDVKITDTLDDYDLIGEAILNI